MRDIHSEIANLEARMEQAEGEQYLALCSELETLVRQLPKSDWRPTAEPLDRRGITMGGPFIMSGEVDTTAHDRYIDALERRGSGDES